VTSEEIEAYLVKKIEETEFSVLCRNWPINIDALVLVIGPKGGDRGAAVSISGLEMVAAENLPNLLDCRVEQARATLRNAEAA
jgi:hypothetical protein